uniref:Uncharacterized protein n=1 Tax=Arundo donax TaxID=35708 RepID=A0A0A8Z317_ARUDO
MCIYSFSDTSWIRIGGVSVSDTASGADTAPKWSIRVS